MACQTQSVFCGERNELAFPPFGDVSARVFDKPRVLVHRVDLARPRQARRQGGGEVTVPAAQVHGGLTPRHAQLL